MMEHAIRIFLAIVVGAVGIYLLGVDIDSWKEYTGALLIVAGANILSGSDS